MEIKALPHIVAILGSDGVPDQPSDEMWLLRLPAVGIGCT
jgi:hypothetical protein